MHQKVTGVSECQVCLFLKKTRNQKIYVKKENTKNKNKNRPPKRTLTPQEGFQWPWSQHGPANFKPRPYTCCLNESVATKRPAYR